MICRSVGQALDYYFFATPTMEMPFQRTYTLGAEGNGFLKAEHSTGRAQAKAPAPAGRFETVEFDSPGGLRITADVYSAGDKSKPTILLFHQSGSSRGEYRQIAGELVKHGFNALAVDMRRGARDAWNQVENETAQRCLAEKRGLECANFHGTKADILAALKWLGMQRYKGPKLIWGSSISSILVFEAAMENPQDVDGVLSFSPGEYEKERPKMVEEWAAKVTQPVFVACGVEEEELSKPIFDAVPGSQKVFYRAGRGRHGSSILLDDAANWKAVWEFLGRDWARTSRK